jgi:hypothetical protein|uniref:Uncharacterized protein n=1 Tax=Acrobeloides nanus TaxID=290746 RepID=A0A914E5J1_9BILA
MAEKKPTWDYSGFNDVHWRPVKLANRTRTISTDSGTDSLPDSPSATSTGRRFSITNMLFGSPGINRQGSLDSPNPPNFGDQQAPRKPSMVESVEKMMKEHRKILDDIP